MSSSEKDVYCNLLILDSLKFKCAICYSLFLVLLGHDASAFPSFLLPHGPVAF